MTILALQASVSKTTTFTGAGVDVSGVPASQATLKIHISSFTTAQTARVEIQDTVDNFSSDILPAYVAHIQGGLTTSADRVISIPWYDIPNARFGVTSAKMRVKVSAISGGTMVYDAWVEY